MFLRRIIRFIWVVVLIVIAVPRGWSQSGPATDTVYWPGYFTTGIPLSAFLPQSSYSACIALEKGDLASAETAFANEMRHKPNDFVLAVGFIQAAHGEREMLLNTYLREEAATHTPVSQFKLGVLAYYLLGEQWNHGRAVTMKQSESLRLRMIASVNLQNAYERTQDPMIGFFVADAAPYLKLTLPGGNGIRFYENMLARLGGDAIYHQYQLAKQNDWTVAQPPIPRLPQAKFKILRYIIGSLYSEYGSVSGIVTAHEVNGHTVYETKITPADLSRRRAAAFLKVWRERMVSAIASSSVHRSGVQK